MGISKNTARVVTFFSLFVLIVIFSLTGIFGFSGAGAGTSGDPYQITNCTQLQEMNTSVSSHYKLINNIDCSDTWTWNGGNGFWPIGWNGASGQGRNFAGSFNGGNYTINNLSINRVGGDNYNQGLFYNVAGAVYDLYLMNITIAGQGGTGGFASTISGTVTNVHVQGNVSTYGGSGTGGFVDNAGGTITKSSFTG